MIPPNLLRSESSFCFNQNELVNFLVCRVASRQILGISYGIYAQIMALSFAGVLLSSILVADYPAFMQKISDLERFPGKIGAINLALARGLKALGRHELVVIIFMM